MAGPDPAQPVDLVTPHAFEREPQERTAMWRPPRPRDHPLLSGGILGGVALSGGFSALAALAIVLSIGGTPEHAAWVAFTTLVVAQLVRANANRSLDMPIWNLDRNGLLAAMAVVWLGIHVVIPFLPAVADAFAASPLTATEWGLVAMVALAPAALAQVMRALGRTWVA